MSKQKLTTIGIYVWYKYQPRNSRDGVRFMDVLKHAHGSLARSLRWVQIPVQHHCSHERHAIFGVSRRCQKKPIIQKASMLKQ